MFYLLPLQRLTVDIVAAILLCIYNCPSTIVRTAVVFRPVRQGFSLRSLRNTWPPKNRYLAESPKEFFFAYSPNQQFAWLKSHNG